MFSAEGAIHWKSTKSSVKKAVREAPSQGQSPSKPVRVRVLTDKTKKNKMSTLSNTQCGQCDKSYASLVSLSSILTICMQIHLFLLSIVWSVWKTTVKFAL